MDTLLYYKEASDGQILEEGINEARFDVVVHRGRHGLRDARRQHDSVLHYYSDVRFPAIGDLIWAAGDARARGFLLGGTSGRTTLAGEGLQHQDGNSQLFALAFPNCLSYDPAFPTKSRSSSRTASSGCTSIRRASFYYLTVMTSSTRCRDAEGAKGRHPERDVQVSARRPKPKAAPARAAVGSGAILPEVIKAQEILESKYDVSADVWSVTSYTELYRDGHASERWNMLHRPTARACRT